MKRLHLNWKNRSAFTPVIGFKNGEEATRPSGMIIQLDLMSGLKCEIDWHILKINNKEIDFEYVRKIDKTNRKHCEGLLIQRSSCILGKIKHIGYINGKRMFIATSEGTFNPGLYFRGKDGIDELYGVDSWQAVALLCWWMIYRD